MYGGSEEVVPQSYRIFELLRRERKPGIKRSKERLGLADFVPKDALFRREVRFSMDRTLSQNSIFTN
ncbi:hypothetical protein ABFA07_000608 [Porites harrisoni]